MSDETQQIAVVWVGICACLAILASCGVLTTKYQNQCNSRIETKEN